MPCCTSGEVRKLRALYAGRARLAPRPSCRPAPNARARAVVPRGASRAMPSCKSLSASRRVSSSCARDELRLNLHGSERRAQFVRGIGDEGLLRIERGRQPRQQRIQRAHDLPHFLRQTLIGQRIERFGMTRIERARHALQGREPASDARAGRKKGRLPVSGHRPFDPALLLRRVCCQLPCEARVLRTRSRLAHGRPHRHAA
ncbi:hypothetical protein AWB80_00368 [Caballeronia pedi]|uniref:Uncharacterized protein n=1 Tax=Caballeronia pedi TaxID=1777141 RepID=A0A157Z8L4_9BURK|nr:hypothetical protein AWB80_00368 [Caballeronia pedi]